MSPFRPVPNDEPPIAASRSDADTASSRDDLPFARGRRFASLDEYLAFRRQQGAIDLPWYEEVEPGLFELRTSIRPAPAPRRFTRAELTRKFGFAR